MSVCIEMPGCNGTEVAASLPEPRPKIIFCTAHDAYAVEAFELHAADYLLKPVNRARLGQALDRVRAGDSEPPDPAMHYPSRFLAKRSTRYCVVPARQVLFFASEGGQTKIQTSERHYWMQPTLTDLEQRVDPKLFFRLSRSAIVNLEAVAEVEHVSGGHGEVKLTDGSRLEVSRRRFRDLLVLLQK